MLGPERTRPSTRRREDRFGRSTGARDNLGWKQAGFSPARRPGTFRRVSDATGPVRVGSPLSIADLEAVASGQRRVRLDDGVEERVRASRRAIERIIEAGDAAPRVYGVNTGFGALSETRIG